MQMEDTKEQYRTLYKEADHLRKKLLAVIQDNNTYRKAQERMELQIYAQEQDLAQTQKQVQFLTKRNKDLEKRLENELQSYENDRTLWQQREHELAVEIKRWAAQDRNLHPRRTRSATASNIWIPQRPNTMSDIPLIRNMGPLFEDNRQQSTESLSITTSRDVKSKAHEKLIADFKSELEQQKALLHEALSTAEAHAQRVEQLEQELASLRQVNASLMEDNESYQMLLHEKTIAGEFPRKSDNAPTSFTLAAELDKVQQQQQQQQQEQQQQQQQQGDDEVCCSCQHASVSKQLSEDNRLLQESNKALTLYMNKILLKIVDNQNLVDVLNIDEDEEMLQQQQQKVDRSKGAFSTGSPPLTNGATQFSKRHYRTSSAQAISLSGSRKKDEPSSSPPPAASSGFRLSGSHWTTPIKWVAGRARAESLSKLL
ncbi:hypothetical protein BX666DRAFT_1920899 [Dichotomocladium elegans]|nr:hypothetical protein BX666DRAFT_1920899 [Dichotomocladium elegans]